MVRRRNEGHCELGFGIAILDEKKTLYFFFLLFFVWYAFGLLVFGRSCWEMVSVVLIE